MQIEKQEKNRLKTKINNTYYKMRSNKVIQHKKTIYAIYRSINYLIYQYTQRSLQHESVEGFLKKRAATYSPTFAVPSA